MHVSDFWHWLLPGEQPLRGEGLGYWFLVWVLAVLAALAIPPLLYR
jgi:hypothetical protein